MKMRAVLVEQTGDPSVLQMAEIKHPNRGQGKVRVKVDLAGLNFIDTYQRKGQYKMPLPFIPGSEAGGVVDALGPGVSEFHVGDRVAYCMVNGAYAEYHGRACRQAGSRARQRAADDCRRPHDPGHDGALSGAQHVSAGGDRQALIHTTGGTGRLLVQVAKRTGAYLIGTAGNPEKAELARATSRMK